MKEEHGAGLSDSQVSVVIVLLAYRFINFVIEGVEGLVLTIRACATLSGYVNVNIHVFLCTENIHGRSICS